MATHDYVIDNSTGANVRADLNLVLQAILSNNSSSSAPSTTAAYMWWADTTTGILKIRNSANNAWVELLQLDGTLTLEDGSASTPALAFRDDLNTGIFSSAADTFNIATGGVERMELGAATVFNEDGADVDFRIEGDSDANNFYLDASTNRIGIGQSVPEGKLHIENASSGATYTPDNADVVIIENSDSVGIDLRSPAANSGSINFSDTARRRGGITYSHSTDAFSFLTAGSVRATLDSSGKVGIGTSSPTSVGSYAKFLQISNSDSASVAISRSASGTAHTLELGAFSGASLIESTGATSLRFKINSSERMRIDSSGKVGIGTTSPTRPLHIASDEDLTSFTGTTKGAFCISNSDYASGEFSAIDFTYTGNDNPVGRIATKITSNGTLLSLGTSNSYASGITNEALIINSSGNVGIGTTSPSTKLDILRSTDNATTCLITNNGTTGGNCLKLSSGGTGAGTSIFSVFNNNQSSETEVFKIDGSGRVGIGVTSFSDTSSALTIKNMHSASEHTVFEVICDDNETSRISFSETSTANNGSIRYNFVSDARAMTFHTNGNDERMRIDSSGRLLVGTTTNTIGSSGATVVTNFAGNADNGIKTRDSASHSSVNHMVMISGSTDIGQIVGTTSSVSYNSASDYRLKENVVAISDGISRLKSLKPSRFNFKVTPDETVDGFLAHEVMSIVPQAVSGTKDAVDSNGKPIHQSMDSAKLVPLLVAAVQELITKVETLEAA